ncbi:MAG: putative DCC family thiol-disulfide oxidoreductase YuxK [Candidatus Promineifilaceae bacterium]|jgi:predicted DCC family thiol-disulfide oxidoreductase YuxK
MSTTGPHAELRTVSDPPAEPTLVYDGDCGFCRRSVNRLRRLTAKRITYRASQDLRGDFSAISEADFEAAIQFIETDGRVRSGAHAIMDCLRYSFFRKLPLCLYGIRPLGALMNAIYDVTARHRAHVSRACLFLFGKHHGPSQYTLSRWLFIRGLALIFFVAFVSFWGQVEGLIGRDGILPAARVVEHLRNDGAMQGFLRWPTLFWLSPTDGMLHALCATGTALSLVLLTTGALPGLLLLLLWAAYLSLATAGQVFMGYQWDILLLETSFLAIFLAPFQRRLKRAGGRPPSRIAIFLMHWLVFRLMFRSGLVKLASGDDTWWNLTALQHHYWTQPLPTRLAWHMHHLPDWFHTGSTALMFAIELLVPFLFFAPRRLRRCGALATIFLMIAIAATGNYGFFNGLTVVLCIPLLDDHFWPAQWRSAASTHVSPTRTHAAQHLWHGLGRLTLLALTAAWLLLTLPHTWQILQKTVLVGKTRNIQSLPQDERPTALSTLKPVADIPEISKKLAAAVYRFRSVGHYGLFANMTERRPEIIVQGSADGQRWIDYEFRWKPGLRSQAPTFVAPHMPRLDWQMWFAALGDARYAPWFGTFLKGLLENSPEVTHLLKTNPFPQTPPRYVRARLFDVTFSDVDMRAKTRRWWTWEDKGYYIPLEAIGLEHIGPTN